MRTHPLTERILPGVTRKVLMELFADLKVSVREEPIPFAQLFSAEEVFVCGSTTDVTPVVSIDGKTVGTGKPGPMTVQIRDAFEARLYQAAGAGR
jgi:D-alanine transaminase